MNRRDFVKRIMQGAAAAIAAGTFDLDKALWVPGEKTFFLPEPKVLEVAPIVSGAEALASYAQAVAAAEYEGVFSRDIGGGWRWTSRGTHPAIVKEREMFQRAQDAVFRKDRERNYVKVSLD